MINVALVIQYDGRNFSGSQYQPNRATIQGELSKALHPHFEPRPRLIFATRTDAGVSAERQVVSVRAERIKLPPSKLPGVLNRKLPPEIRVLKARTIREDFHPRYDCTEKIYRYSLLLSKRPSVFKGAFAHHYPAPLNIRLLKEAALLLAGEYSFKNLSLARTDKRKFRCRIKRIWMSRRDSILNIYFSANRFLYRMVRVIVGLLLDINEGRVRASDISQFLSGERDYKPKRIAPPQGLTLSKIIYQKGAI